MEFTSFGRADFPNNAENLLNAVSNKKPTNKNTFMKLLHDARVTFKQPERICKVYVDTETYWIDPKKTGVPLAGEGSRLSMV